MTDQEPSGDPQQSIQDRGDSLGMRINKGPTKLRKDIETSLSQSRRQERNFFERRLQPLSEGLIIDNPQELAEKVGLDNSVANTLVGVHLMDKDEVQKRIDEMYPYISLRENYDEGMKWISRQRKTKEDTFTKIGAYLKESGLNFIPNTETLEKKLGVKKGTLGTDFEKRVKDLDFIYDPYPRLQHELDERFPHLDKATLARIPIQATIIASSSIQRDYNIKKIEGEKVESLEISDDLYNLELQKESTREKVKRKTHEIKDHLENWSVPLRDAGTLLVDQFRYRLQQLDPVYAKEAVGVTAQNIGSKAGQVIKSPALWISKKMTERNQKRKETVSPKEAESWRGLIFDDPEELAQEVGLDPRIAEKLKGVHLMDEKVVFDNAESFSDDFEAMDTLIAVQEYRQRARLGLVLSPEEIEEVFGPSTDEEREQLSKIAGVDLANTSEMLKMLWSKNDPGLSDVLFTRVDNHVRERIKKDLTKKAEQKGKSWQIDLKEAGISTVRGIRDRLPNLKLTPQKKKAIKNELKMFGQAMKVKNWAEVRAIAARIAADFSPEVGLSIMIANLGLTAAKEFKTLRRIQTDEREGSAMSEYFRQTTLGKLVSEKSPSKLSRKARITAGFIGSEISLVGLLASEATSFGVRVPGVRGVVRATVSRAFYQYIAPRAANFMAGRLLRGTELIEGEEQRKDWVDLALRSSSLVTTALTSMITIGVIAEAGIDIDVPKSVEALEETLSDVKETIENIEPEEALETIKSGAEEGGLSGAISGASEVIKEAAQRPEPGVETVEEAPGAPEKPGADMEAVDEEIAETGKEIEPPVSEVVDTDDGWEPDESGDVIVGGVLENGKNLLLDPNSKGIPGLQYKLANDNSDWTPDEVAIAATRAYAEGITADDLEAIGDITKPEMPAVLGKVDETITESKNDGWEYDDQKNIVGGTTENGDHLFFDVRGEGTPRFQYELANLHKDDLVPWTQDEVAIAAYRAFLDEVDPNDPSALEGVEKPIIETPEQIPDIENLVKEDQGHDTDNDGADDSWWLKDKETGKIEAGLLPDKRILYLGEEGGVTGVVQEHIVQENSNLSPPQVATISSRAVENFDLQTPDEAEVNFENIVGANEQAVINSVNSDIARFSLQQLLLDKGLNYHQAREVVWGGKIGIEIDAVDKIFSGNVGASALNELNARINIDGRIRLWQDVKWKDWLQEKGHIK